MATCSLGLVLGDRVVMSRRFDPEATLAAIAEYRVRAVVLVPTMLQRILDLGPDVLAKYDTHEAFAGRAAQQAPAQTLG